MLNKMAISEFWSDYFGKMRVGGSLGALWFFWSLKKDARTFHFRLNEPSRKILGPLDRYDHPWEKEKNKKQKKTNKHASVICLLAKNTKLHIFVDRNLELVQ